MRNTLAVLMTLAAAGAALAQPPGGVLRARVPDRTELAKINMAMDWNLSLPIEGPRDGIATVQLIPAPDPNRKGVETVLLVVQMRSGAIAVYYADSGRKLWSKRPAPAYPVFVPEVAYDPRGALMVVRDMYLYRYDIYPTQAAASTLTDETDNRLVMFPTMPSVAPTVVVADPTKRDEGLIVVCFNGSRLATYGKAPSQYRVKPDSSVLSWRIREPIEETRLLPADNKAPSLTVVDSVFGPDYGTKDRPREPQPKFPSLTLLANLSRPDQFGATISSTPSITIVPNLWELSEMSQRDARPPSIESSSRRGDILDFRLAQPAVAIRSAVNDRIERSGAGLVTKLILVGTDRNIQFDTVTERLGLLQQQRIGPDLIRSQIAAPVAFSGSMMFVPTADGVVMAIDAEFGLVSWTASLQNVASKRPAVVGPHVFVTTRMGRMYRLNSDTGDLPADGGFAPDGSFPGVAIRDFLAASDRAVYAVDRTGNLLVLDRRRGTLLGQTDVRGFTIAMTNDTTDRVILGSPEGRLICLRDAAAPTAKVYRSNAVGNPAPAPVAAPITPPTP